VLQYDGVTYFFSGTSYQEFDDSRLSVSLTQSWTPVGYVNGSGRVSLRRVGSHYSSSGGSGWVESSAKRCLQCSVFSVSFDSTKYYHIFRQLEVVQKLVGLNRVQSFMLILGRSAWVTSLMGLVGSGQ